MEIKILYEDSYILVIDKPWGVVVNRCETSKEKTIQDWLLERSGSNITQKTDLTGLTDAIYNKRKEFYDRAGIVHRLDKDTSGVLIIAKNPEAFANLQDQFKKREVVKEYIALVHGDVLRSSNSKPEFVIDAPIGRNPRNRMKWAIVEGGKEAKTIISYQLSISNEHGSFSLIKCKPKTGRTHQIRVHLASFGYPIVSDPLYLGKKLLTMDLGWCPRMFLHAVSLSIKHPVSGKRVIFKSPIPRELGVVLQI
jgi:23S rRNA pseudouridine1911/1915/1917 synthase